MPGATPSNGRKSAVAAMPLRIVASLAEVSEKLATVTAARRSNAVARARQSRKLGCDAENSGQPPSGLLSQIRTRRSGSANGSGRSTTVLTTEKIAVFAPMPSASVSNAMSVKPGVFTNILSA